MNTRRGLLREQTTAAGLHAKVAFEIDLSQIVRLLMLETDKGLMLARFRRIDQALPPQRFMHVARGRQVAMAQRRETRA